MTVVSEEKKFLQKKIYQTTKYSKSENNIWGESCSSKYNAFRKMLQPVPHFQDAGGGGDQNKILRIAISCVVLVPDLINQVLIFLLLKAKTTRSILGQSNKIQLRGLVLKEDIQPASLIVCWSEQSACDQRSNFR